MSAALMWSLIAALGLGTFAIRFSFLGLLGDRTLPAWAQRLLRYTPVAVLPGIAAPLMLVPEGGPVPLHVAAVLVAVAAGWGLRSAIWGVAAGAALLTIGSL